MRPTATNIASVLTQKGYKLTAQRRAVIDVVANSLQHFTPNVLYERVRWTHPAIGLVTVYRTLEMLSELGLPTLTVSPPFPTFCSPKPA